MITQEMISQFFVQGLGYGAFALLLMYTLKKQEERDIKCEKRESNYQKIIDEAMQKLNIVIEIKKDMEEVKQQLKHKRD